MGPAMNILPFEQQIQVISALTEGCSIRATERLTGVHRDTVMRLGARIGTGCAAIHDGLFQNLNVPLIELDEIWSYVGKKQRRLAEGDSEEKGDCYVFTALDATRKAILSYHAGKRNRESACVFLGDLRERVLNRPQISSDAFLPYRESIELTFGADVHYGQIVKQYAGEPPITAARRYSPGYVVATNKTRLMGNPDERKISTSLVERSNLTMRMQSRRFTRLTNGYSKKLENHKAAVALYVAHYNLCRVHETIRMTPAMALGLTDHIWTIGELIERAGQPESIPATNKPFTVINGGLS
jgi:IS1 family transposase